MSRLTINFNLILLQFYYILANLVNIQNVLWLECRQGDVYTTGQYHHQQCSVPLQGTQGSVATRLRCGGICIDQFVTQSLLSLMAKEL